MRDSSFWERYHTYLRSAEWKAKRKEVMKRSGGVCEQCRERKPVHIHHLTYQNLGREPLIDLLALCKLCHQRCHPHRDISNARRSHQGEGGKRRPPKPKKPRLSESEKIQRARAIEAGAEARRQAKRIRDAQNRKHPEGWEALVRHLTTKRFGPVD